MHYKGSCHCGSIRFEFEAPNIKKGLRCDCSICLRKGAMMSAFTLKPEEIKIKVLNDSLATYEFGEGIVKHHFCSICGIYTFHQTMRKPGHYRVNLGAVEGVDSLSLPFDTFKGSSL